jgi:Ca-activated chloride channel family protein
VILFDWLGWTGKNDCGWLIWVVAAVVAGLAALELRGRDAMATFLSPVMGRRLSTQASMARTIAKLVLIFAALAAGVFALIRPQKLDDTETAHVERAADVMFVLDTSRSMLADDAPPNRLARAKAEINALIGLLEQDKGRIHRVGLIAFAGRAVPVCPLTPDHAFFNTVLGTVDTRSAGKGGTKIGTAIRAAIHGFPASRGAKVMVLITDGDDQDPYSEEAAKEAREAGVHILVVGLGSETGAKIMLADTKTGAKTPLMYNGEPVISKLDAKALERIALTTEGAYIPAGTHAVDLGSIMASSIDPIVTAAEAEAKKEIPAERFQWCVLVAIVCLLAALAVGAGSTQDRRAA